ncbi:MAG: hypothetical protein SGPRY_013181 [Prymnesium sp.]
MYFQIHDKFKPKIEQDDDLMTQPFFWTEHVLKLFGPEAVERVYPTLNSKATVYYDVVKLCLRLLQARGNEIERRSTAALTTTPHHSGRHSAMPQMHSQRTLVHQPTETRTRPRGFSAAFIAQNASMVRPSLRVKQSSEILDTFENDQKTWDFFASIFSKVSERAEDLSTFDGFELNHLSEMAKSGRETLDKLGDLTMAREAMLKLFETYLLSKPPAVWKELFREAAKMAFNVKYMFREEVMLARARFNDVAPASGGERQMMNVLIEGAFGEYGEGLVDQETLAASNFLTEPQELLRVVRKSSGNSASKLRLIRQIVLAWMEIKVEAGIPPLAPHHTQARCMLRILTYLNRAKDVL